MTTQRIKRVLDKLYNLKGDYNYVIAEIEEKIKESESAITTATEEQNENEIKKSDIIGKLTVFNNQKDAFLSAFSDLDDDTFSSLRDIGINANFGTMVNLVNEESPKFCDELNEEIEKYESNIEDCKNTVTENAKLVAELEDSKKIEIEKRSKLVSLLEQSLSTEEIEREALSTSYVKKIINAFDIFTEEEVTQLAKLIMFPEDGLIEYNDSYTEEDAAKYSIYDSEPVEEPTEDPVEEDTTEDEETITPSPEELINNVEEPTEEEDTTSEEPVVEEQDEEEKARLERAEEVYQNIISNNEVTDIIEHQGDTTELSLDSLNASSDDEEEKEETPVEETPARELDEIDKYIESTGLDITKVSEELKQLLSESDIKQIEENYEILRSAYVSEETIYNVVNKHNYLTDADLNKKITLLRAKGISELKIKELLEKEESKLREDIDTLGESIDAVANKDGKITNDNIYKIDLNNDLYDENKKALENAGYDIEEKEERNFSTVIYSSPYINKDIDILKEYLISIIKRNSKYALSVFWKNPTELMEDIDDIIESGLENILETNPEVLEESAAELIKRVKYCEENDHKVYLGEDKDAYCDYITSYARFQEKIGAIEDLPELNSRKNNEIVKLLGDSEFAQKIVSSLEEYYKNPAAYDRFSDKVVETAENIRQSEMTNVNYEDAGKYTYKINDVCISKNKISRNIKVILNTLESENTRSDGHEKEILLASILYNLRADDDTMKKISTECLN